MNHTDGQWKVGKNPQTVITETSNTEGFEDTTGHIDSDYYGGILICESVWKIQDAQLIASAPDLLEALQEIIPFAERWINNNHPSMKKAKMAIQKAVENNF